MDLLKIRPTSSLADQERYPAALRVSAKKSTEESCREIAEKALADLGSLPATKTFELYLIRALAEINIDGIDQLAVIYPPEFLFLLDAGLESLVGVSVPWENVVRGDPTFPDFGRASLYSVASRGIGDLIFPMIPGSNHRDQGRNFRGAGQARTHGCRAEGRQGFRVLRNGALQAFRGEVGRRKAGSDRVVREVRRAQPARSFDRL